MTFVDQNLLSDAKDKVKALELHLKSMIVSTNVKDFLRILFI